MIYHIRLLIRKFVRFFHNLAVKRDTQWARYIGHDLPVSPSNKNVFTMAQNNTKGYCCNLPAIIKSNRVVFGVAGV